MKTKSILLAAFLSLTMNAAAQINGSDTVCAGLIYTYSVNIPGAVTYTWTIPTNWYDSSGQGTSLITVKCNSNAGQVCAEGFDSVGTSVGVQCLTTTLGAPGGGGGSWTLWPSGSNSICDNFSTVTITPEITFTGGGGGCPGTCGTGQSNANAVWALYSGQTFIGVIGGPLSLGIGTYYAAYVDTSLGCNFPQAVQIVGGCGGGGGGSFSISQISLWPWVQQTPWPVCVGDTVLLEGLGGGTGGWGGPYWNIQGGLDPISSINDPYQLTAIVTSISPSVYFSTEYQIQSGFSWGSVCSDYVFYNVNATYCNTTPALQASNTVVCESSCIDFTNLSLHATNYEWSFPGGVPAASTDTNPSSICYSSVGSYDVVLISSNAQYSDTLILPGYINVVQSPQASFTSPQTIACSQSCIGFTNTSINATSYQWTFPGAIPNTSTDSIPQNICYNTPGTFDVTLVCSNGACTDSTTIPNHITIHPQPEAVMSADVTQLCPGGCTGFINASIDATTYQWSFPGAMIDSSTAASPSNVCYNVTGSYDVMLISSNVFCSDTLTVSGYIIVYALPPPPNIIQNGDSLITNTGYSSYQWYFNGNIISGATESHYLASQNGDYHLVATDSNGCEVEAGIFNVIAGLYDYRESNEALQVGIFPNPTRQNLMISYPPAASDFVITVYNLIGEKMMTKPVKQEPGQTKYELDTSLLPPSCYEVNIISEDLFWTGKFVKQ